MKIGLIVPPFIPVPPPRYGGTELFIANLAEGLRQLGHHPIVYSNGESTVSCEVRWLFPKGNWPIQTELHGSLDDINHTSWACQDAARECDVIHLNNAPGLSLSRMHSTPFVYTLHHPRADELSQYYAHFPKVNFVAISHAQARRETLASMDVVHHGIDLSRYQPGQGKREYLLFMGRIAPIKGVHHAIEVARRSGIPLKIAGEIQPMFRPYWEEKILPAIDGHLIQYVGEADLKAKNELFGGARALLFPVDWEEPFGLVMIEAMACGTPVLAFPRGSAPEVVRDGVSGWLCADVEEMVQRAEALDIEPGLCRDWVEANFSVDRMVLNYLRIYDRAIAGAIHPRTRPAGRPLRLDRLTEAAS